MRNDEKTVVLYLSFLFFLHSLSEIICRVQKKGGGWWIYKDWILIRIKEC